MHLVAGFGREDVYALIPLPLRERVRVRDEAGCSVIPHLPIATQWGPSSPVGRGKFPKDQVKSAPIRSQIRAKSIHNRHRKTSKNKAISGHCHGAYIGLLLQRIINVFNLWEQTYDSHHRHHRT